MAPESDRARLQRWQRAIRIADRRNVFCHCRHCQAEWVDSSRQAPCLQCGSLSVERIPCWQFPDG